MATGHGLIRLGQCLLSTWMIRMASPFPQQPLAPPMGQPMPPQPAMPQAQPQPMPPMLFDVTVRRKRKRGQVKLDCIAPESVYVSTRARSIDPQTIPYMGIRCRKTLSDLVAMGYAYAQVIDLRSDDQLDDLGEERIARGNRVGSTLGADAEDASNPMMREVWYNEEYVLVDADGDGIAERRAVCSVGDTILHNEIIERVPLAIITPKIMPHEFYGISLADDCMDLQLLKSTLWRATLNNNYLTNTPMQEAVASQLLDIDDLLNPRPGGIVRVTATGTVTPLTVPFMGDSSLKLIEFLEQEVEGRTGINRYGNTPSLNPDSLNKTLGGAEIAVEKSQARLQLICRTFAETGIKDLFSGILWLLSKNQDKAMTIRIRNKWVNVDPRAWSTEYDFVCNVGLGTGSKDQQMQHMMMFGQVLEKLAQQGCVTPKNGYNFGAEYAKLLGFKDTARYLTDPNAPPDPANPRPPPPKDPKIQVEEMRANTEVQKFQAQKQAEVEKFQAEQTSKRQLMAQEAAAKERVAANDMTLQQSNDQRQSLLDQQKHELAMHEATLKLQLDEGSHQRELENKKELANIAAAAQVTIARIKAGLSDGAELLSQEEQQAGYHIPTLIAGMTQAMRDLAAPKEVTLPSGKVATVRHVPNGNGAPQ